MYICVYMSYTLVYIYIYPGKKQACCVMLIKTAIGHLATEGGFIPRAI